MTHSIYGRGPATIGRVAFYPKEHPMIRRKHRDTRDRYQPLADGETFRAPGQEKPLAELIAGQRTVRMWSWRPNR